METVKKALKGIFICLLSIILMSHNTSALTLTQDVSLLSVYSTGLTVSGPNIYIENQEIISAPQSGSTVNSVILNFRNMSCAAGNYLQTNINVFRLTDNDALNTWVNSLYGGDNDFSFIDTEYEQLTQNTAQIRLTLACTSTFTNQNKYLALRSTTNNELYLYQYDNLSVIYTSRFQVNNSATDAHETAENLYQINQKIDDLLSDLSNNLNSLEDINDNIDSVNDTLQDHYEQENEAYDNISNQDPSDLQGDTDNQASTNLIGLFQSFITALSNVTQANNCNLQLNFPSYAGGTITVNVCQYKDKGGNIVAIFSSLTLIVFYIPLALKLLSMIYNEIRSFTNG